MLALRRSLSILLILLGIAGPIATFFLPAASAQGRHAAVVDLEGPVDAISAGYLGRAIDAAAEGGAELIVVLLDTPGGRLDSTRDMVEDIIASEIPVVVYVSPPGAQAASAGTFIAAAAHVAAMSPTTSIGAATPVGPTGEDLPETMESKATQDAAAFIRSIAERRGRNGEALEATVLSAASYSASEALASNVIDLVAENVGDLLAELDGRTVDLPSGSFVLETEGLELREIDRSPLERFFGIIADPNIAFLLISLGGLGLIVELWNPGLIVPGTVGVVALGLGFVALGNLPVNWVGAALLALGILLFIAELQAPGLGVFGISGGVCFVVGAFLLFGDTNPPGIHAPRIEVSIWAIAAASILLASSMVVMAKLALDSKRTRHPSQMQTLVGQTGYTRTVLEPQGSVQVASELWSAVSESGQSIGEGVEVLVVDMEGLTLKVAETNPTGESVGLD